VASAAFSLIEVMVVLGVMIILSVVAFTSLVGKRSTADLNNTTEQIAALLRESQSHAQAQDQGTVWGVHFASVSSTSPAFFALFKGSWSAANLVGGEYPLPPELSFATSAVPAAGTLDVIFSQLTGLPNASATITLQQNTGGTYAGGATAANISRPSSGKIFFDNFQRANL
jgi:type II secretory pathway pseudopilin PulG